MNVAGKAALAVAGFGLTGLGCAKLLAVKDENAENRQAVVDRETITARAQWDTWKRALDGQFPGRVLNTPADHARFEQFLKDNPAPKFVQVTHEGRTKIHTNIFLSPTGDQRVLSDPFRDGPRDYKGTSSIFGVASLGVGIAGMYGGIVGKSFRGSEAAVFAAGGGLMAAVGIAGIVGGVQELRATSAGERMKAYGQLVSDVNTND